MKYTRHILINGTHFKQTYNNLDDCMHWMMQNIYSHLGNGDGKNGGKGSLWHCASEIYNTIKYGGIYEYADCRFWVTAEEECGEPEKEYTFGFSAVVSNQISVKAKSYNEALTKYRSIRNDYIKDLADSIDNTEYDWDYDGNVNDEFENVQ